MPTAPTTTLPDRWFRTTPDSSHLTRPRLLARSLVDVARLDDNIRHYEQLTGIAGDLRMPIPDFGGLELAAVDTMLLIASARPFTPIQRQTAYSVIVPSLDAELERLLPTGTELLEPPETILPGSRARVRFPDGSIAELVEHRPQPGEVAAAPPAAPDRTVRLLLRKAVSRAAFADTVALYETLLDATVAERARPEGPYETELARIGDLLIVGTDGPEYTRTGAVRLAVLTSAPRELPGAQPLAYDAAQATSRHHVMRLQDGWRAELWDPALFTPDPAVGT
ncbi:VOC family protein [Streptomyces sp. NPDC048111]|uniref:VOC family protein n=1 Tax=Streptomyces sp. NPDC048111 TaxID=3365500 RepID=UPI003721135F